MKPLQLLTLSFIAAGLMPVPVSAQTTDRLTIMTYNVENFFDAVDDPRMPNGEGAEVINSPAWVSAKASAVARVIQRFDFGKGPDVLVLTEVESQAALDAIKTSLKDAGAAYPTAVLIDADPQRPAPKPDGQVMTVFGGHLPSGGNPRVCREIAARTIATLAARLPKARMVIAAGDLNFNCAPQERKGLSESLLGWALPLSWTMPVEAMAASTIGRKSLGPILM